MRKLLPFGFAFASVAFAAPDPLTLMQKNEEVRRLSDVTASATLTTGGGSGPARVKQFTWWRKLRADGARFNTLTRFHQPAEIRGEGILFLEASADQSEVLMYLPAYKKIRRVESQQQSTSFMGSEFSYSDIATPHVADYRYRYLREEACPPQGGPASGAGLKCHVIESTPATEAVRERTGYSKSTNWIRQDNFMEAQVEFFGTDGDLKKRLEASDLQVVDAAHGKWMAHRLKVTSAATRKYTLLEFKAVKANTGIPDSIFTQQRLSSER